MSIAYPLSGGVCTFEKNMIGIGDQSKTPHGRFWLTRPCWIVSALSDSPCDRSRGPPPLFSVDGVVSVSGVLADQFTFVEATSAVYDHEVCGVRFVALRELTEFVVPINELFHTLGRTSAQTELPVMELVISALLNSGC